MARRKKAQNKSAKKPAAPKTMAYKIDSKIAKPKGAAIAGKTPERLTLEKLKVGQSFALPDRSKRKRVRDICYRLKLATGRVYSLITTEKEVRVWRDK